MGYKTNIGENEQFSKKVVVKMFEGEEVTFEVSYHMNVTPRRMKERSGILLGSARPKRFSGVPDPQGHAQL